MTYAEWTEVRMQVMYEQELQKLHNTCQMTIDAYCNKRNKNESPSPQNTVNPTQAKWQEGTGTGAKDASGTTADAAAYFYRRLARLLPSMANE
jgi:hypothetical protein